MLGKVKPLHVAANRPADVAPALAAMIGKLVIFRAGAAADGIGVDLIVEVGGVVRCGTRFGEVAIEIG